MAVGADKGLAGNAKTFQMDLMTNSIAGAGIINSMFLGDGLDKAVIVRVFKTGLEGVVVNIGNGTFRLDPRHSHGLKFQIRHGACGILG